MLKVTAGPQYIMLFSPADLQTVDSFANAIATQSNIPFESIKLDTVRSQAQAPEETWADVADALRWLALTEEEQVALANKPDGFRVAPDSQE